MDRDQFIQVMSRLATLDFVKAFKAHSPTEYAFEIRTKKDGSRSQVVYVALTNEGKDVLATSKFGDCPTESKVLMELLAENRDGYYSRICAMDGELLQVYRYSLEHLEPLELALAIDEVARYADIYENKYFGGVDNT